MYDWNDNRIITKIKGDPSHHKKRVVLTFDDGPTIHLEEIRTILKTHQVKAVFFWLTSLLNDSNLVREVEKEGHIVGLHGIEHIDFTTLNRTEQTETIKEGLKVLQNHSTRSVQWFRPPYGRYDSNLLAVLKEYGLQPLLWEIASLDWECENDPDTIIDNVVNNLQDGAIILLHELPQTVAVLGQLIERIRKRGYEIVLPE